MCEKLLTQPEKAIQISLRIRLKADQPMEWVGRMNSIRARAEEIVMEEVINTL